MIEYLSRFNDLRKAIGIDLWDSPFLRERLADRPYARFETANTQLPGLRAACRVGIADRLGPHRR